MMGPSYFIGIGAEDISESILVDTHGHCLLCLVKLQSEKNSGVEGPSTSSLTSLHILSRYLGIDLKKLIMQNRSLPISSQLKRELLVGDKVGIGIKGLLCGDCAQINRQFSEVFLQLEKIQMEVASSIKLIRWKLMEGDEGGQAVFRRTAQKEEAELVEALREEAREKCSTKLNSLLPPARAANLGDPPKLDAKLEDQSHCSARRPKSTIDPSTGFTKCGSCDRKPFKTEVDFLIHFKQCHQGPPTHIKCMDCGEVFDDPGKERTHWRLHYGALYECSTCREIFSNCALPKHHKFCCRVSAVETSRLECSCRLCRKGFISLVAWKQHLKFHTEKVLLCNICGKKFRLPTDLGFHRRGVHGIIDGVARAPPDEDHDMGQSSSNRALEEAGPTPEPLEVPPFAMDTGQPESIVNSETGAHKCSICSAEFLTEPKFKTHFKQHLQIQFKCRKCSETFGDRLSYVMHYRRNHQGIMWSCVKCNKIFPRRQHLRRHRLKEECPDIAGLEVDACSCRVCKRYFPRFRGFQSHFKKVHK